MPLGIGRPGGIAITPNGAFAYVTIASANVAVISTATKTVVATVPVGSGPFAIDITPNGALAYVTNSDTRHGLRHRHGNQYGGRHRARWRHSVRSGYQPEWDFRFVANSDEQRFKDKHGHEYGSRHHRRWRRPSPRFSATDAGPTDKDQCKNGGWATFTNPTFSNRGPVRVVR